MEGGGTCLLCDVSLFSLQLAFFSLDVVLQQQTVCRGPTALLDACNMHACTRVSNERSGNAPQSAAYMHQL
jgi:hypothetical protein